MSKITHTRNLKNSPNTLGYRLGRVRLFQRYLVWVILTTALTAVYYLYTKVILLGIQASTKRGGQMAFHSHLSVTAPIPHTSPGRKPPLSPKVLNSSPLGFLQGTDIWPLGKPWR